MTFGVIKKLNKKYLNKLHKLNHCLRVLLYNPCQGCIKQSRFKIGGNIYEPYGASSFQGLFSLLNQLISIY